MKRILFVVILFWGMTGVWAQDSDALQDILAENLDGEGPAMVVLLSSEDETQTAAIGLADLQSGQAAKVEDRFRIGSVTKTYVAVLALLLQEEGILNLDNPISDVLDQDIVDQIPYGDEITIRQLLNMTSGIFNYTDDDDYYIFVEDNPSHIWTAEESVAFVYNDEPLFAPGEGYYYSNTNYNLMQIIIENLTGNSLAEEMEARIFAPLGMDDTELESNGVSKNLVRGYSDLDGDGELDDVTEINDVLGTADGGIISTLADMELFGNALFRENSLLSDDSWEEMTDWVDDGEGGLYGLGLSLYEEDGTELLGHSGATAGFASEFWYIAEGDLLLVALSNNFDTEDLALVLELVAEWLDI